MKNALVLVVLFLTLHLCGCEKEKPASQQDATPSASNPPPTAKPAPPPEVIALGITKVANFEVRASRDKVEFKAGGEAPIDVWIDEGLGKDVAAVRFWIGTQDAKGSMKAKAEVEKGKWHTHAKIPSSIPAGSMLWIEIEQANGQKVLGSFDLKL